MSLPTWKCYRCDLTYKEESTALLHSKLCNHPVVTRDLELLLENIHS